MEQEPPSFGIELQTSVLEQWKTCSEKCPAGDISYASSFLMSQGHKKIAKYGRNTKSKSRRDTAKYIKVAKSKEFDVHNKTEERLSAPLNISITTYCYYSQQYQQQQASINNNISSIGLFSSREVRVGCVSRFRSLRILEF
uniref:Uncharacterized protein n=1 Tax=Glossina austeni TaxID=7395 RepID=A0A1A9UGP6_GLOAU